MNLHSINGDILLDYLQARWPEHEFHRQSPTHVGYTSSATGQHHSIPNREWANEARLWHQQGRYRLR